MDGRSFYEKELETFDSELRKVKKNRATLNKTAKVLKKVYGLQIGLFRKTKDYFNVQDKTKILNHLANYKKHLLIFDKENTIGRENISYRAINLKKGYTEIKKTNQELFNLSLKIPETVSLVDYQQSFLIQTPESLYIPGQGLGTI